MTETPASNIDITDFRAKLDKAIEYWDKNYDSPPKFIICSPDLVKFCTDMGVKFRIEHTSPVTRETTKVELKLRMYGMLEYSSFRITNAIISKAPTYTVKTHPPIPPPPPTYPTSAAEIASLLSNEPD